MTLQLIKLGYNNIDGLDASENMAKLAMKKNIYKKWYKAYLCKDRLPIDDGECLYHGGIILKLGALITLSSISTSACWFHVH